MYTYLWCFFTFAFLGWCGEVCFAAIKEHRFVNRGFLNGTLCPIYGLGVVLIDFCLRPFGNSLALLLIGSMVVGSGLEWLAGFLLEKLFHQKWWDYSNEPHNLNGYICLRFSILWAFSGALVVGVVMPFARQVISHIPRNVGWPLLIVFLCLTLADFVVTVVAIVDLNMRLKKLEYVSRKLKVGSDFLGERLYQHVATVDAKLEGLEKDWQKEAARLKEKYEQALASNFIHRRLLRAFPDLRSLRHNEELENIRLRINEARQRSSEAIQRRNEAAIAAYEEKLPEGAERPFAFGLCYEKLFWIFMIGSVVGFVLETLYALAVPPHQFELRVGLVIGPFIPVYGLGAVAITLVLYRMYNQRDFLIFLASLVIGAGFEYLCSFLQQAMFGTVSWEYSDSFLNISGRTNLLYGFFWGILGLVWVKDLYPVLSRKIQRIPKKTGRTLTVIFTVFMAFDIAFSAGAVYRQSQRVNQIPATNSVQRFFDAYYPDEVLEVFFPNMQYVGRPELPVGQPPPPFDGE